MTYYNEMFTRNKDLNISHRYGIDTLFLGVCFIYLYMMLVCVFIQLYLNYLKDDMGRQQEKKKRKKEKRYSKNVKTTTAIKKVS